MINCMKCIKQSNVNIYIITWVENFEDQSFQYFVTLVLGNIWDINTQPYNEIEMTTSSIVIDSSLNMKYIEIIQ